MAGEPARMCPTVEELPYGWQVKRLGSFCTKIGTGATPRGGSEVYLNSRVSHALVQQSRTLAALRDTLLPKLLSGELSVKRAENEVSA